jgi:hypothetical protein
MRFAALLLVVAACASTKGAASPAAQEVVDRVAGRHPELVRLTLHAVPEGGKDLTQVASTLAARRGKKSDPEDFEAMKTGKVTVLDEAGNIDVTVPILEKAGTPTAVAGVTLKGGPGADKETVVMRARAIAQELANEIRAAKKPLW